MKTTPSHLLAEPAQYLKDLLLERRQKNRSYSARAFARDLGLSPAFLSQVMSSKRNLSLQQKLKLADHLGIDQQATPEPKYDLIQNSIEHEKIIKHWYHFAIMELFETDATLTDAKEIAKRLPISELEAETAIQRLIEFGYVKRNARRHLQNTKTAFLIDAKSASTVIRQFHQSRLVAALEELNHFEESRVESRAMHTVFLPTSRAKAKIANEMINQFQNSLIEFLTDGPKEEVFQLSLQLFSAEKKPRTKRIETKNKMEKKNET
jgi:transcriptional regulator with XRE-family HTH domain